MVKFPNDISNGTMQLKRDRQHNGNQGIILESLASTMMCGHDARIAERVVHRFTRAGIPLLCIHDSFIVPYDRARILKATMRQAARVVVGAELAVEANGVGLDEQRDSPLYVQQDYILWRQTPRCAGYLARLQEHEERWG